MGQAINLLVTLRTRAGSLQPSKFANTKCRNGSKTICLKDCFEKKTILKKKSLSADNSKHANSPACIHVVVVNSNHSYGLDKISSCMFLFCVLLLILLTLKTPILALADDTYCSIILELQI